MNALNDSIREYQTQLKKGQIQEAYRGIMGFLSGLSAYLAGRHPDFTASALYFGYMDMSYFAFTPSFLREKKLKLALVYLHETGRFELWLAGSNKKVQAEYIELLKNTALGVFKLSQPGPGTDSILEVLLIEQPDFEYPDDLKQAIETKLLERANELSALLA